MSDYPGVTKAELEKDIAPVVRKWLERTGHDVYFDATGRDAAGHKVYTHAASGGYDATVVYEGRSWTPEFIEEMNGGIDVDDRTYEIEEYSSYEMVVRILDEYR